MRIISLSKFRFLVKNNFKWKTHYHNISEYNYNDKISCFHFRYISVDKKQYFSKVTENRLD